MDLCAIKLTTSPWNNVFVSCAAAYIEGARYMWRPHRPKLGDGSFQKGKTQNWTNGSPEDGKRFISFSGILKYNFVPVPAMKETFWERNLRFSFVGETPLNPTKHIGKIHGREPTKSTRMALALPGVWATQEGWGRVVISKWPSPPPTIATCPGQK